MRVLLGVAALIVVCGVAPGQENWPQWRGPALNGTATSGELPLRWSETDNVKWKVGLPSWSGSTPAIWGDRIFVMSPGAAGSGPQARSVKGMGGARKPEGEDIFLLCFAKKDGAEVWRTKLSGGNVHYGLQNMSSPSPVTDGTLVWALTGTGVVTALDMKGKVAWRADLQDKYGKFGLNWGYGASPLLYDDKLIVPVMHGMTTDDPSYLVAFEPKTGKVVWRVERPTDAVAESPDAYTTPVPLKSAGQFIISGADYVTGHELATGKEVWRCAGLNPTNNRFYRTVATPVIVGDIVVACAKQGPTVACRLGGKGDVTESHGAWTSDIAYDVPTPVTDGKYLYVVNDRGFCSCLDPKTGKWIYQRKRTARGTLRASPLLAGDRIYLLNQKGVTSVIATGAEFKLLATNKLDDDYTMSSIAVSGKQLFIRTSSHLYCIGK